MLYLLADFLIASLLSCNLTLAVLVVIIFQCVAHDVLHCVAYFLGFFLFGLHCSDDGC